VARARVYGAVDSAAANAIGLRGSPMQAARTTAKSPAISAYDTIPRIAVPDSETRALEENSNG